MITGIHHVALHTAQFDRMKDFYERAFGFVPITEPSGWSNSPEIDRAIGVPGSAARTMMMRAGRVCMEIFEYASPPAREGHPLRPNDHGYTHFAVDVTDLTAVYDDLIAAGMRFGENQPIGEGGIRAIYGYDPDGNVIEVQQLAPDHPYHLDNIAKAGRSDAA
ncbi:VOC family protein [Croceicoccus ponticola]|uniref:VOC family protein n=1 Tax=Croceicoccus ponticola TaxID=2217664 RepID=A0A437GWC8_9SPHN|nr:VOC family protein [Croceicoccus ponticola]RVQ65147.1 VOC family protein [Croceicoccus ponticola]